MSEHNILDGIEIPFSSIKVSDDEIDKLKIEISKLFKDDIKAFATIKELEKTEKTLNNSLGNVYEYLIDRQKCLRCKRLSECNKKSNKKGYILTPYYEKERDEIRLSFQECNYQKEKSDILNNIFTSDFNKDDIYKSFDSLLSVIQKDENYLKMKDTSKLLFSIKKDVMNFKVGKKYIGYSLSEINKGNLVNDLLSSIAFMYARYGFKISYFDTYEFFLRFLNNNFYIKEDAMTAFKKICNSDVVIFKNFDAFPKFELETLSPYLYEFLLSRDKIDKVTYFSSSISIEKLIYYRTKDTKFYPECDNIISKIVKSYVIKDIDLR